MKKFSVVALILVLAIAFTGCTNNEKDLIEALNKTQNVDSMESEMAFNIALKGEGFAPEDQIAIDQMSSLLSNFEISMTQKMKQNEDKTAAKASVDMKMNFGGMIIPMSVWVDTDMSGESTKLVEYIKMPQMFIGPMFPQKPNVEYIVFDFQELMGEEEEQVAFNELMKLAKEMEPKFKELIKSYIENFDSEVKLIEKKDEKEIDGEKLSIYEVKLDDKAFKELLRYTVNYSLDNEELLNFMKEYMKLVASISGVPQEEVATEMDNLAIEIPEVKAQFNKFMDSIKDIKIIGDNGIVIEYGINKDGYIAHEAGSIDLRLDLGALSKLGEATEEPVEAPVEEGAVEPVKGILSLGINFTSKVKNINGDIEIVMPEVNEDNSVSFMELMSFTAVEVETVPVNVEENTSVDANIEQNQ